MRFPLLGPSVVICCGLTALFSTSCTEKNVHESTEGKPSDSSHATLIEAGGSKISLEKEPGAYTVSDAAITRYVKTAAEAASGYYGRFPVPRATIRVSAASKGDIVSGVAYDGRLVTLAISSGLHDADLQHDWVATHEIFHLAFPDLGERYKWMNEGLSDYLEPISRARIGTLSPEEVWRGFVEGMPQGLPQAGDEGLDDTKSWGRIYWGGCIYWLLADVRIREQTHGRKSLQDALRAILAAGGDGSATWSIDHVFEVGDTATGTHVLKDLHDELGSKPVKVDLDGLWKQLGVTERNGHATFDDRAPQASIRKSITAVPTR